MTRSPSEPPAWPPPDAAARPASKRSRLRTLAAACIIVAGFFFVAGLYTRILTNQNAVDRDFVEYWAEGQLLVRHLNPFDPAAILHIQQVAGLREGRPRISFSPPVALWFTVPLGWVSARTGLLWWLMAQLVALSIALWLLWILNGRPDSRWHLLGYIFAPAIACQMAGQLSIFFLLCLVGFLLLYREHPFLAGALLMPCALKPHVFLPFALVLLPWVLMRRRYSMLGGFAVTLAASCAWSLYLAPHGWTQYRQMMAVSGVMNAFVPALPVALRFVIDRNAVWIQFVPEVCACGWALWYFWTRRARWEWADHGLVLLMVAAICTPYGWFFDETILFPAVLAGLYRALERGRSVWPLVVFGAGALGEILAGLKLDTPYYLWTAPAWLGWYLYATRGARAASESPATPAEAQ